MGGTPPAPASSQPSVAYGLLSQDTSPSNTQNSTGSESHPGPLFFTGYHAPDLQQKMELLGLAIKTWDPLSGHLGSLF